MKEYEMYKEIQKLKNKGYSRRRVSRELKVSRETAKKYWLMNEHEYAQTLIESKTRTKILDPYREFIIQELENYREMNCGILFDHLKEHFPDLSVAERTLREYVGILREELGLPTTAKIRQYQEVSELAPGFQAQVDMGEKNMRDFFGKSVKIYIFAMVMAHSRKKFVCFQDHNFNASDFIAAHDMAFRYFGGRTEEIVYDQDRVMAVSENAGDLILTEKFQAYREYAGFAIRLCRGFDPESKGKIEAVIKYVKNNFLTCREYPGISKLNSDGLLWLERTANSKKHDTTYMIPNRVFEEEIKHLTPVPTLSAPPKPAEAIIRPTNVIHYLRNRYEVPKGTYFPGRKAKIEVCASDGTVKFFDAQTGETLARHDIAVGVVGKKVSLPKNYERFAPSKYDSIKTKVLQGLDGISESSDFVERIIQKYPRYVRDQLSIIAKTLEIYGKPELSRAIAYCFEHELFSANDFRDALEYFRGLQPPANPDGAVVPLPAKYSATVAQVRPVSDYNVCAGGVA